MTQPVGAPTEGAAVPTQVRHSWRAVVRTGIQTGVGLAATVPVLVTMSGVDRSISAVATTLAVSAVITKVMALPEVNAILTRIGLGAEPKA